MDRIIIKKLSHKIIDEMKVKVDERHEIGKAIIPSLNLRNVMISDSVVDGNNSFFPQVYGPLTNLKPLINRGNAFLPTDELRSGMSFYVS